MSQNVPAVDHFIVLNCVGCGGKLDVYDDMERFVCGYCGSAILVKRRGGTVELNVVTAAIKQVQVGTDKTAAELALVRYEKELRELRQSLVVAQQKDRSGKTLFRFGVFVLLVGSLTLIGSVGVGITVVLIGSLVTFFGRKESKNKRADPILERIEFVKKQMTEKKQLVDS